MAMSFITFTFLGECFPSIDIVKFMSNEIAERMKSVIDKLCISVFMFPT